MVRAVLLTCPVCGAVRALDGASTEHPEETLRAVADTHLDEHGLTESSHAIRKHQTSAESTELIVTEADHDRLPTEAWQPRADAWLPDGTSLRGDAATSADSVTDMPSTPHAED